MAAEWIKYNNNNNYCNNIDGHQRAQQADSNLQNYNALNSNKLDIIYPSDACVCACECACECVSSCLAFATLQRNIAFIDMKIAMKSERNNLWRDNVLHFK